MSRAERLLSLLQLLRRHRRPVSGAALAEALGVSLRTLYRDIASLQAQGAAIDGAPGFGYVLQPGFMLPPLMFTPDEVEALVLGSRWVAERADARLGGAARQALAKIGAVLPPEARQLLDGAALLVGPAVDASPPGEPSAGDAGLASLRLAMRAEHKLVLGYRDAQGRTSERTVWPIALGFFDRARVLVAWCELRQELRHFRIDRITALTLTEERYPRRRQVLLREWREAEGLAEP
jgi:predicted DNA-binding transcriptional regulator YafY